MYIIMHTKFHCVYKLQNLQLGYRDLHVINYVTGFAKMQEHPCHVMRILVP